MSIVAPPSCDQAERPQFDLKFGLLALAITALVGALSPFIDGKSHILTSVYGLTFLFGCCKTRRGVLCVLPALYLPFAWQTLAGRMQPIAIIGDLGYKPGLRVLGLRQATGEWSIDLTAIFVTLAIFLLAVTLARPSSLSAAIVSLNLFCISWLAVRFF